MHFICVRAKRERGGGEEFRTKNLFLELAVLMLRLTRIVTWHSQN